MKTMKSNLISIMLISLTFFMVGCGNEDTVFNPLPVAPQGVNSITGNNAVYLFWNGPYDNDIQHYVVWRSLEPTDNFVEIATVDAVDNAQLDLVIYEFIDVEVINGVTYYYAVSSVDNAGQSSDLSAEDVFDTPRPDGQVILFDYLIDSSLSGYNFAAQATVDYNSLAADIYIDRVDNIFYINASDTLTDLQDMGFTDSFDDISFAPQDGWSENGWLEIIVGHSYVVWTNDLHYAKIRVISINTHSITFRWAYQTDQDNPELKPIVPSNVSKPVHSSDYLNKDFDNQ